MNTSAAAVADGSSASTCTATEFDCRVPTRNGGIVKSPAAFGMSWYCHSLTSAARALTIPILRLLIAFKMSNCAASGAVSGSPPVVPSARSTNVNDSLTRTVVRSTLA